MNVLLYNPNCNAALTADLVAAMRLRLAPNDTLESRTASNEVMYIGSEETIRAARNSLETDLHSRPIEADAIVVACFGDLGLGALQRSIDLPLVTLWDAYILAARATTQRFGLVTTSAFWVARMQEDARRAALADRTVIRAIDVVPGLSNAVLADSVRRTASELVRMGVDAIVPGGALFASFDAVLATGHVPVVDLNAAALRFCRTGRRFVTP
jgi:allantoin racemase